MLLAEKLPWVMEEEYRAIRTNISLCFPDEGCKIIGISSAEQHDGKSVNCINVATSFAQIGKRTLIFDCDMRLPTISAKLNIPNKPGLVDFLVGQETLKAVLHRNIYENLDVITAGSVPPDPTWLLQSERMKTLLTFLRQRYDYIFVDLPPVNTVADASIVAKYIDGFLLVVRENATTYPSISKMLDQLHFAKANIIGFLYNDKKSGNRKYYKSYYGNK